MFKIPVAGLALAMLTFGLALTWNGSAAKAQVPAPGLNFSISIAGVPGCDTGASGAATCNIVTGTPFTLHVNLVSLPTGYPRYFGFDLAFSYTGVTPAGDPSTNIWPDCGFPVLAPASGSVAFGCAMGLPPAGPSTYLGPVGTAPFTCAASGTIVLSHSPGDTDLVVEDQSNPQGQNSFLEPSPTDTLNITCGSGPGAVTPLPVDTTTPGAPTATPLSPTEAAQATATAGVAASATAKLAGTAVRKSPTPTVGGTGGGGSGIPGWAIALIIVGGIAASGGVAYASWRYRQSRPGAGGAAT